MALRLLGRKMIKMIANPPKLGVCFGNNPRTANAAVHGIKTWGASSLLYPNVTENFAPGPIDRTAPPLGLIPLELRSYLHPGGTVEFPKGPIPDDIPLSAAFHPYVRARSFIGAMVPWAKLTDPFVLKPARSAVELYNQEQNAKLKFVSLQKAYIQVVCGCKFRLTLEAMDDGVINKYEVEITSDASNGGALELESFVPVADNRET